MLAGAGAAARYLTETGWAAIQAHERELAQALVGGLAAIPGVRIHGAPAARTPTVFFEVEGHAPAAVAAALEARKLAVGHGSFYAIHVTELLGIGEHGALRAGAAHYTSREEVERLVDGVAAVAAAG